MEQSVGYQLTDWAVLGLGVNWHRASLRSRFRESDPADVWYEDRRHMSMFGAKASVCLVPNGAKAAMTLCIEEGVQRLQHTFDSSRSRNVHVGAVSQGVSVRFWHVGRSYSRTDHEAPCLKPKFREIRRQELQVALLAQRLHGE